MVVGLALKGLILPYAVRVIMINYTRMQSMLESPFGTTLKELEWRLRYKKAGNERLPYFRAVIYFFFWKRLFYLRFHWQFWTTKFYFWLLNIMSWKFDTSSKKEMRIVRTQIFWWKTKKTKNKTKQKKS